MGERVRHLGFVSWAMVIGGVLLLTATILFDIGVTWALVGLLLAWAGVVKVVTVALWRGIANPHAAARDESENGQRR